MREIDVRFRVSYFFGTYDIVFEKTIKMPFIPIAGMIITFDDGTSEDLNEEITTFEWNAKTQYFIVTINNIIPKDCHDNYIEEIYDLIQPGRCSDDKEQIKKFLNYRK